MPIITELTSYPVKGCAGVTRSSMRLTERGLEHDRTFMVVDGDGNVRTQRRTPRLAGIRAVVERHEDSVLRLDSPTGDGLTMAIDRSGPRRHVTMFGTTYASIDQGDEVATWLSDTLGCPCRLVRIPPDHRRDTDGHTRGTSGFADSCAVLVVSTESLESLNSRIVSDGGRPVLMSRFRPNIVVSGHGEPHWEDTAERLTLADAELGFAKHAVRCAVTLVDQQTGVRDGPEPLRTLARYRRRTQGVVFGAKFAVRRTGLLDIGRPVEIRPLAVQKRAVSTRC